MPDEPIDDCFVPPIVIDPIDPIFPGARPLLRQLVKRREKKIGATSGGGMPYGCGECHTPEPDGDPGYYKRTPEGAFVLDLLGKKICEKCKGEKGDPGVDGVGADKNTIEALFACDDGLEPGGDPEAALFIKHIALDTLACNQVMRTTCCDGLTTEESVQLFMVDSCKREIYGTGTSTDTVENTAKGEHFYFGGSPPQWQIVDPDGTAVAARSGRLMVGHEDDLWDSDSEYPIVWIQPKQVSIWHPDGTVQLAVKSGASLSDIPDTDESIVLAMQHNGVGHARLTASEGLYLNGLGAPGDMFVKIMSVGGSDWSVLKENSLFIGAQGGDPESDLVTQTYIEPGKVYINGGNNDYNGETIFTSGSWSQKYSSGTVEVRAIANEEIYFRTMEWCENNVTKSAYFLMSEPKEVVDTDTTVV